MGPIKPFRFTIRDDTYLCSQFPDKGGVIVMGLDGIRMARSERRG